MKARELRADNTIPEKHFEYRKKNEFYTKTAKRIFLDELEKRRT